MAVLWQPGKRDRRRAELALLLGTACLAGGCQSSNESRTKTPDPLMGEKAPLSPSIGPTPPPQNRANMNVPPPPTTASKSIAAMVVDPLTGGKTIGIPDPNAPAQTAGGWIAKDKLTGTAGGPTVNIRAPEQPPIQPVPPPTYNPNLPPVPGATAVPVPLTDPLQAA